MKKLLLPLVVAIAVTVVAPKFFAQPINDYVGNLVQQIDNVPGYKASVIEYDKGWFNSSAVITIKLDGNVFTPPNADSGVSDFIDNLEGDVFLNVQHGPLLTDNGLSFGLAAWSLKTDKAILRDVITYADESSLYSIKGTTDFSGNSHYADKISSFTFLDNSENVFSGWAGKGTASLTSLTYSGSADSLAFVDKGSFAMNDMKMSMDLEAGWLEILENPIYNSHGDFSIGSISLTPINSSKIEVNGLLMNYKTQKNSDETLVDMSVDYKVDSVEAPKLTAKDFIFKLEINNLEKGFLQEYQSVMQDPKNAEQGLQNLIENSLLTQLQAAPEINITELSVGVNDNLFSANLFTKLDDVQAIPQQISNPKFWASHTTAKSTIKADKAFVSQVAELVLLPQLKLNPSTSFLPLSQHKEMVKAQIDSVTGILALQGMLVETDSAYESVLSLENGTATINGQETPLPF